MFKATIMGRLTADPTQREFSGSRCTEMRVACETRMKDPNDILAPRLTNFIRVSIWGTQGDMALKYFHKGDGIACSGDCAARTFKGKDGKEYLAIDLMNADFAFPPVKKGGEATGDAEPTPAPKPVPVEVDDSLPF